MADFLRRLYGQSPSHVAKMSPPFESWKLCIWLGILLPKPCMRDPGYHVKPIRRNIL